MSQNKPYIPDSHSLKRAITFGEVIREHLINIGAFDAAAAMRDLLALAYNKEEHGQEVKHG